MNADTLIGGTLVVASLAFLLIAGLARAAGRPRPTNAAPAPALTRAPVRAPSHPTDLCMHHDCLSVWTHSKHGWNTCDLHANYVIPPCKVCHNAPATEFGRLCLGCHERIRDHFDEFVDQALAIGNNEPDPADEVGEADLSLWELENGWAKS